MKKRFIFGIIGGGFMGHAIANGAIRSGFLAPDKIIVSEPIMARTEIFRQMGVCVCTDNRRVAENCEYLLFAVKPQVFPEVAVSLRGCEFPTLISIMAGKTKESVRAALGAPNAKIARAMPNLPCSVGEGMTGIDTSELSETDRAFVVGLFSANGKVVETAKLDAVTGISGSGPAYVYLFLQALVKAGVEQGFGTEQARLLALQTLKGGVKMVEEHPEKSLSDLIAAVSSKGGTTVAALNSFEKDAFEESVSHAVAAAVKRAEELSE